MDMDYEENLIVKTAWYYYLENMTQQSISELLGISRMRVIKLLEKARQTGIIQFHIRESSASRMQVEQDLMRTYGLKDAFIVPTNPISKNVNESIAKAAAMYVNDRLSENSFINIGYGDTAGRVLNNLATITERKISCVSLTGGVNYYLPNTLSNTFGVKLHLIPAPLLMSSSEMAASISQEDSLQDILRMVTLANFSVLGIGAIENDATIINSGILSKNDFLYLKMQGVVGDLLCNFIDAEGRLVRTGFEDRLIGTPLETLRGLDNVIGVAAGRKKITAIRAALRGKYLDVLITDEDTALGLIENT